MCAKSVHDVLIMFTPIRPITIRTLGDLVDRDYALDAWCRHCLRGRRLSIDPLVERMGRDADYLGDALARRLRCEVCGGRDVAVNISPPAWRVTS
jgi:hypothetical protein